MKINVFEKVILATLMVIATFSCQNQVKEEQATEATTQLVKANISGHQQKNSAIESDDQDIISFWNEQKKGANYFNQHPTKEWFESAAHANIKLVRLTYEKWKGEKRDFLLGSADDYQKIVESDFQKLKKYLDIANKLGVKVVISPLSLPGARYSQSNGGKRDGRLWKDKKYLPQAIQFWKDLATKLKGHPAVVGYNLINEPFPEWFYGKKTFWDKGFDKWYKKVEGTPGDLNLFNKKLVKAIRAIDPKIPIIVESGLYATPWAFEYLEPINDDKVIYSFHMYEPYDFTTKKLNNGRHKYPGNIPISDMKGENFYMDKKSLVNFLTPIKEWAEGYDIPSNRIWAGEFGCDRSTLGAEAYLTDLIEIFNQQNWHWAFYAYREDNWQSMDYELGTKRVFWKYWDYTDDGTLHLHYDEIYSKVKDHALWNVFSKELNSTN